MTYKPAPENYWYCPECKEEKGWRHVTYQELCADCGTKVIAKPLSLVDAIKSAAEKEGVTVTVVNLPDDSTDGLLTELERDEIWENATSKTDEIDNLLQAQALKTYPLAFEAGKRAERDVTKKDYIALAKAIKENREIGMFTTSYEGKKIASICDVISANRFLDALCDILAADNKNFDKSKFMEACK